MGAMDFYDLIDTYAQLRDMRKEEALHLWYRGGIDAVDLLAVDLEDEGISSYVDHLVNVIRILGDRAVKDGKGNPWIANNRSTFDVYVAALHGVGPKMKEYVLEKAAQDENIGVVEMKQLIDRAALDL